MGGTQLHGGSALPVGGAEQHGRRAGQGAPGQFPGPGVHSHHLLVRVLVEQPVADAEVAVLIVGIAVNAPEAVLLLAPQRPLGGVEAGAGEGGPDVRAVAGHGMVEAAAAQQPEVGHPGLLGGRRVVGGPVDPAAAQ